MTEPITIGVGSCKWVKDSDTKALSLWTSQGGSWYAVKDDTATTYQVPVGKKFIMLLITKKDGWTADTNIYHGYIANNSAGGTQVGFFQSVGEFDYDCYIEVPAGDYINIYTSHSYAKVQVFGVETNA